MPSSITCTNLSGDQINDPVNITTNTLLNDSIVNIAPIHLSAQLATPSRVVMSTNNAPSCLEYQMVTQAQRGIARPNPKYALVSVYPSIGEPKHFNDALVAFRVDAMHEELQALEQNNTWVLVPRTPDMDVVDCKWIYITKSKSHGSTGRFKAILVTQGYSQISRVDFDETFTPVIKPTTI